MPEELIFFAVIIFFSIIDSIARSRKARKKAQSGENADLPPPEEWSPDFPTSDLQTYDADSSYDDAEGRDARDPAQEAYTAEKRTSASQTMLPSDLFEELAGLAGRLEQGRGEARTLDLPKQSPKLPEPEPERVHEVPDRSRVATRDRSKVAIGRRSVPSSGPHLVHRAHEGYGTDPSERAASEQDGLDPLAQSLGDNAVAIRKQLLSHAGPELRQAVILQEVLGKPVSLRDE